MCLRLYGRGARYIDPCACSQWAKGHNIQRKAVQMHRAAGQGGAHLRRCAQHSWVAEVHHGEEPGGCRPRTCWASGIRYGLRTVSPSAEPTCCYDDVQLTRRLLDVQCSACSIPATLSLTHRGGFAWACLRVKGDRRQDTAVHKNVSITHDVRMQQAVPKPQV